MFEGRRVFLIDTPGFDDTHRSDTDVLTDVACFLSTWYQNRILLTGIIYLHRITDRRMAGSALKNLSMFQKLCGEHYFNNVVLATTMWGNLHGEGLSTATGEERERELVQNPRFWGAMYQRGSRIMRHIGKRESAWGIISYLASLRSGVLNIQDEMVNQGKRVSDTAAGKEVERDLQAAKEQYKKDIAELHKNHEDALKNRDEELAKVIEDEKKRCEEVLRKANEDTEKLQADFGKLKKDKDDQYQKLLEIHNKEKAKNEKALIDYRHRLDASEKRNKEEVERLRAEYQALLEQQQQIQEWETSASGLFAMLAGMGMAGLVPLHSIPLALLVGWRSCPRARSGCQRRRRLLTVKCSDKTRRMNTYIYSFSIDGIILS